MYLGLTLDGPWINLGSTLALHLHAQYQIILGDESNLFYPNIFSFKSWHGGMDPQNVQRKLPTMLRFWDISNFLKFVWSISNFLIGKLSCFSYIIAIREMLKKVWKKCLEKLGKSWKNFLWLFKNPQISNKHSGIVCFLKYIPFLPSPSLPCTLYLETFNPFFQQFFQIFSKSLKIWNHLWIFLKLSPIFLPCNTKFPTVHK